MDNKKRARNLLLYLAIPIILIIIAAVFLSTRGTESPKTSELVQLKSHHVMTLTILPVGKGTI